MFYSNKAKGGFHLEKGVLNALPVKDDTLKIWETRLEGEPPKAFTAFCAYKSMGLRRDIKECMRLHEIDLKKYGTWSRWARLYRWKERAACYDEYITKETEKALQIQHVQNKKEFMAIISDMNNKIREGVKKIDGSALDAEGAMDLLERSAKLDGYISGADREKDCKDNGQLSIQFVDSFKGL